MVVCHCVCAILAQRFINCFFVLISFIGDSKFLESMKCAEFRIEEDDDEMETSMSKLTIDGSDDHDDVLLGDHVDDTGDIPLQFVLFIFLIIKIKSFN